MNITNKNKWTSCNLCYNDNEPMNRVILDCSHCFHINCIREWINLCISFSTHPTCPYCRSMIDDNILTELVDKIDRTNFPPLEQEIGINDRGQLVSTFKIKRKRSIQFNPYSFSLHPSTYQPSGTVNISRIDNSTMRGFSLHPENYQPSGHVNISRINESSLQYSLDPEITKYMVMPI